MVQLNKLFHINTDEIPGAPLCENIFTHKKITGAMVTSKVLPFPVKVKWFAFGVYIINKTLYGHLDSDMKFPFFS